MLFLGSSGSASILRSAAVLLALPVFFSASCHRVPLTAPSGSALTLLGSENLLPVNGSAEIIAILIEGAQGVTDTGTGDAVAGIGTPVHDGTLVIFTTTLGRLEPTEARTSRGRATVTLYGDGRSGTAKVTAYSGGAINSIEIDIGAAGATRLAMTADPQSLPSTGGSSLIAARLEDQQGNGVAGIPISFSTTRGSLSPTTAVTDDQGYSRTTLTTSAEAIVTGSSGGSATALIGSVQVTIR